VTSGREERSVEEEREDLHLLGISQEVGGRSLRRGSGGCAHRAHAQRIGLRLELNR